MAISNQRGTLVLMPQGYVIPDTFAPLVSASTIEDSGSLGTVWRIVFNEPMTQSEVDLADFVLTVETA
jgi:hypothetical protein